MRETVDFSKLISDALDGNDSAFSELYRLTYKTAYHTASLLLNNHDDIEDVLQNAYVKAFKKLKDLKAPESFEGWIKSIVENECRNFIKKEKKFTLPLLFYKNKVEESAEEWKQPIPQEYIEREEFRKNISDIIDSLSPEVRACIILFHYDDKSLNEISEILDIPLGTVKSRLYNGRKQIEKEFNKLRKKDPSLFSIGAIPVILSLLSYQAKNIVVPEALSESVLTSAITAASAAGTASSVGSALGASVTTTSTVAAGSAATTAAVSIAVKATAVVVAGTVVASGSVALKNHIQNKTPGTEVTAVSSVYNSDETHTVEELLTDIISTSVSVSESGLPANSQASSTASVAPSEQTTSRETTTSSITTTQRQTTTAVITTTQRTTTTRSPATTTTPSTTSPENNYSASGGVITEYKGSGTSVSIPSRIGSDTVTAIGAGAFAGNSSIKSVSFPSSVTQIGQEAFADCTSLSSLSLPSSLEHIGIGAFYGCSKLTSVSIPDGVKTIDDEAFAQCSSLRTVTIPSNITSISDDAFDGCDSLTIRCEKDSAAHNFAVANGIDYVLI